MFFLLSGEGITDLGASVSDAEVTEPGDFTIGPLTVMVDQIVEAKHGYSMLDVCCCGYVSEYHLTNRATELKAAKKSLGLPGKKRAKETRYFFNNARALSRIAKDQEAERKDDVVAVLFRDSDGTASAGRGLWDEKRRSVLDGFDEEDFDRGVPMIPKPKSEAWFICALKKNVYQHCEALEDRSGNDHSPKSLKKELGKILGDEITLDLLCDTVRNKIFDIDKVKMPSFKAFRDRLEEAIG
jgi:hypothetical protein